VLCIWRKLGFGALPLLCKSCALLLFKLQTWEERERKRTTGAAKGSERGCGKLGSGALSLLCKSCALLLLFNIYKHGKREMKRTTGAAKGSERECGKLGFGALSSLCKSWALLLLSNIQRWEEGEEEDDRCSEGKSKGVGEMKRRYQELDG